MNKNSYLGKIASLITGVSVLLFAISMMIGLFVNTIFWSCFICMILAIGFVLMMIAIYAENNEKDNKALGLSGVAFGIIYATLIFIVYYAECTTIRLNPELTDETLSIISYSKLGSLFFNYDLLGYGMMSLSTFLIGLIMTPKNKLDKVFKMMLLVHGVFFVPCFIMPMLPIFTEGTGAIVGTIILEVWCLYFLPITVLGVIYFSKNSKQNHI